jgi:molybdenum cofactor biosynthesis protein B
MTHHTNDDDHRSASTKEHRELADALGPLTCAVVVVSDSRTAKTDHSGDVAVDLIRKAGHCLVGRELIKNDPAAIEEMFHSYTGERTNFLVFCGGTGLGKKDITVETIGPLLDKVLDGYGEAFRRYSWDEIGPAAIMSRAVGGTKQGTIVACTPGSSNALRLALEALLLPELKHLVREANR